MSDRQELEQQITWLSAPFGDSSSQHLREEAIQYLLDHADAAHPRLLALLGSDEATNPFAIIDVLPRFGRAESVAVLGAILDRGEERLAPAAALALAKHPLPAARDALTHALASAKPSTVAAAADGLLARGDRNVCAALRQAQSHADARARYHVIQAAAVLECLSHEQLVSIARDDVDADIGALIGRLLHEGKQP